jgi:uncharacterized protein DUF4239
MIDFLIALPLWALITLLTVWLSNLALVGLWIARQYVLPRLGLKYDDAYVAAAVVQSVMLLYGLIAALIAVGVWQKYWQVADVVSGEATVIASLWRDLGGYPEPLRGEMRGTLRGYTEQIIRDAWPQQRKGQIPRQGVEWMDRLQAQLFTFEPTLESQKILHAETLRTFNQLVQQRRQRLDAVHAGLPSVIWYVLLTGAASCIVLCLFFHVQSAWLQGILLVGLAEFLAMVLFITFALDRPFQGDLGITAEAYQLVYEHHMVK